MKTCNLLSPLFITTFFIFNLVLSPSLFGQSRSVQDTVIAREWLDEAKQLTSAGKYEEAYIKADSARLLFAELLGERTREVADAIHEMGVNRNIQGKYNEAIKKFTESLSIRLDIFGELHEDVASSYNNLGNSCSGAGELSRAIEHCEKSLSIYTKLYGYFNRNVAAAFNNIGVSYYQKKEPDKAIITFNKVMEIYLNVHKNNDPEIGKTYLNLAASYKLKGDFARSIELEKRALKIYLDYQETQGITHPNIAAVYNNLGTSYGNWGDPDISIEYFLKALDIYQNSGSATNPNLIRTYYNIGASYDRKGYFNKAIEYKQKALELLTQSLGGEHPTVGFMHYGIGVSHAYLQDYPSSIDYLKNALSIQTKTLNENHPDLILINEALGGAYVFLEEFEKAKGYLDNAYSIQQAIYKENHQNIQNLLLNFGRLYRKQKKFQEADTYYQLLISMLFSSSEIAMSHVPEFVSSLFEFVRFKREWYYDSRLEDHIRNSYTHTNEIISAVENHLKKVSPASKLSVLKDAMKIYESAISNSNILYEISDSIHFIKNTFTLSERSKAYLLYEAMHEANALHVASIPDSLLEQEYNLRVDMAYYDKLRQETLASGAGETDTTVLAISSKLFDVRNQHDALKHHLETAYPEYYRAKYDLSVISVEETRQNLLRPGEALLEYFVGDSAVYVFLVRPDTFAVYEIPKDFDLDALVAQLREGLYGYHSTSNRSDTLYVHTAQGYAHAARQLYERLIAPVQPLLPKRVFIVPDGVLGYVPFEALLMEKPAIPTRFHSHRYFGKEHVISYAYSATLLREMREKKHRKEPKGNILAMAPFYRGDARKLSEAIAPGEALLALRSDTLSALPHSGDEALRIARAYSGKHLLGREATKAAFEREAADYRILHLSTHGVADDRVGDYAWLGFARSGDESQFEKLYVRDIYNLSLNADLVVLSACQAGIGKLQRGEGIISLSRAFAYAGAKGIITTLWSVDDKRTKDFMLAFYGHLRKMPAAEALWQTRHDFLTKRTGEAAHPYFWAGFIGVGDM
jgi:CHAT domain-containing protein/Tfp pilus assembly protein PilF